jgi:nuclear receptor-binding protein
VFDKLIELNHMNIVKFHGYWQDRTKNDDRPRVRHASSLRLGRGNSFVAGRLHHGVHVEWIAEALLAQNKEDQTEPVEEFLATLVYSIAISPEVGCTSRVHCRSTRSLSFSYLHSCEEPIIHGNLTCDTIFIQNNGLVKIGSSKSADLAPIVLLFG